MGLRYLSSSHKAPSYKHKRYDQRWKCWSYARLSSVPCIAWPHWLPLKHWIETHNENHQRHVYHRRHVIGQLSCLASWPFLPWEGSGRWQIASVATDGSKKTRDKRRHRAPCGTDIPIHYCMGTGDCNGNSGVGDRSAKSEVCVFVWLVLWLLFSVCFSHSIQPSTLPGRSLKQHSLRGNSAIPSPSPECPLLPVNQDGNFLFFGKTQVCLHIFVPVCIWVLTSAILTISNVWKRNGRFDSGIVSTGLSMQTR